MSASRYSYGRLALAFAHAERSKPHPDVFLAALERLGNPRPEAVLVVGDMPYDAGAAGKTGLRTICVPLPTCWPNTIIPRSPGTVGRRCASAPPAPGAC